MVVFLANHCPVVKAYEDRLIEFTNAYKDKGVKVVGISVSTQDQDKIPGIKEYTKEHKSNYIYAYDETQAVGKAYGATNTPQFFVLDKERKIRYTGALDDSQREDERQEDLPQRRRECRAQRQDPRTRRNQGPGLRHLVQEAD